MKNNFLRKLLMLGDFYSFSEMISIAVREMKFSFAKYVSRNIEIMGNVLTFKMYIPLREEGIGKALYTRQERELDHKYIMEQEIKPGDVIFDLGANIGYYLLMEDTLLKNSGKIYAVEPDYRNIKVLKRNMELNNVTIDIEIFEAAISDFDGEAEFFLADKTNLNTFNITSNDQYEKVKVQVIEFAKFLKDKENIDLVRMDIEGHEVEVFRSLVKLLKEAPEKAPKKIVFETHRSKYNDEHDMKKVLGELFELGYYPKTITTSNEKYSEFHKFGYSPERTFKDFPFVRGIYKNVSKEHAIELITELGSVRTVLIEQEKLND